MTTSAMIKSAFQQAADLYEEYDLEPDFFTEMADHLHNGIVIARPNLFVMGKAVALPDNRPAWFITAAAGRLEELLTLFPCDLPYIAFRRRGEDRIRVYPFAKFVKKGRHEIHR